MANPLRNEVAIDILGKTRVMRADFEAIVGIEQATRRSMVALVARGDMPVTDMANIIFLGLRSGGEMSLTLEQIGNAILEKGYADPSLMNPVMKFLTGAMNGFSVGKPEEAPQPQ